MNASISLVCGELMLDILRTSIWIHRPASPSIPASDILTNVHKGQILRMFSAGGVGAGTGYTARLSRDPKRFT